MRGQCYRIMYENNETQSKHNLIKTKWNEQVLLIAALIMEMSLNNSYIMNSIAKIDFVFTSIVLL